MNIKVKTTKWSDFMYFSKVVSYKECFGAHFEHADYSFLIGEKVYSVVRCNELGAGGNNGFELL